MDEIKRISSLEFKDLNSKYPFEPRLLLKDYYLTMILYAIKDVKGIYFKGGTALNKIFLDHARLSEDIDFTLTRDEKEVRDEILIILKKLDFFKDYKEGKDFIGFSRMIITCDSELGKSELFIDLNKRGNLELPTEIHEINHFYSPFIPKFSVKTVAKEELIAEKVRAAIERNKPRDHFDIYQIIKHDIPINMQLVKDKCIDAGEEFSIIKMFSNANKLKNRWDNDMVSLLAKPITFQEVMKFLAKHFKLKEEKEDLKNKKD